MIAGCTPELVSASEPTVEFKASYSTSGIRMTPGSEMTVSVFDGTVPGRLLSNSSGTFSGKVPESNIYYAASPATNLDGWKESGPVASFSIPSLQVIEQGNESGMASSAEFFIGKILPGEKVLSMVPAAALVRFSVDADSPLVSSISLSSASKKPLSGTFSADLASLDFPSVKNQDSGKSELVLRSFDGECPLDEGDYFMVLAPGSYPAGDLVLTLNCTNGKSIESPLSESALNLLPGTCFDFGVLKSGSAGSDIPLPPGELDKLGDYYDVYLLIGQSNMAGRGTLTSADKAETIQGVYLLSSDGKPVPATHPFNQYSSIRKDLSQQQMNPGYGFSTRLLQLKNDRPILIVCNARGGTALSEWAKGTEYYNQAVIRTKEAMRYGTLKGILWHQGCSDISRMNTYLTTLGVMVANLRSDLGDDKLPFIAGELCEWKYSEFNKNLQNISNVVPNSACVSSKGCGMQVDKSDPHFNREGQLLLGQRYAEKMFEMLKISNK